MDLFTSKPDFLVVAQVPISASFFFSEEDAFVEQSRKNWTRAKLFRPTT